MDNCSLLQKYRIKLSFYFAFFVMVVFWFIQAIFISIEHISQNIWLETKMERRFEWVQNVIENHEEYFEKINNSDHTLGRLLAKTLEDVIVFEWWDAHTPHKKIIDNIEDEKNWVIYEEKNNFFDIWNYKYLNKTFVYDDIEYEVIIQWYNDYSLEVAYSSYFYFLLLSLPFSILFFAIWYYFVWKNFQPIKETIAWLEDFSSNINHEIKTPLAEIISTLALAKKIKNYDEAIEKSLSSSKKINTILDAMVDMVKLMDSSYSQQKIDIIAELNSIIDGYQKSLNKKKITLVTQFHHSSYSFVTNKQHFEICIWNIISNAIKYSNEWVKIKISFEKGKLVVRDYGIWISKKNLKNIFNRYFRESYVQEEWYGIWLSLVKKIVDLHWWKIKIKSHKKDTTECKKGTKIIVYFM